MAQVLKYICDHCGKEIPALKGGVEVRFDKDPIYEDTINGKRQLVGRDLAEFNFHEACAQRAIEAWDDMNAGKMEVRGGG